MRTTLLLGLLLMTSVDVSAQAACTAGRALVSGYFSNVHVYDLCSGNFEQVLDNQGRISGAQAVWPRPDGRIYVVSEENGRILRYQSDGLAYLDTFIETGTAFKPTGIAFGPDGDLYVAGFDVDQVRRYDGQTGALKSTPVASGAGGLNGPDNGMTFGPDGKLYIPGYNSNNVLRYDPATNGLSTFITSGTGGLRRTRAILFEPGNATVLVSSEGSNQILRFNAATGALVGTFASLGTPAGMSYTGDGRLLVATNSSSVEVLNASSGASMGPLFPSNAAGGLDGSTYVVAMSPKVDLAQVGSQYWVIGAGQVTGRTIDIDLFSATGTLFGAAFRPGDVVRKRWGSVRIEFTGCETANFSWNSIGSDSARFGTGGYPLQSLLGTAFTESCKQTPFDQVVGSHFMNGAWYGGASRDGEGLLITVNGNGLAAVAMFTHQPVRW